MACKIVRVCGGTKEDVLNKKHNIFIGISLGNKFFNKKNLKEYISWALKYTKEKVLILIADKIQAINYEVREKKSSENALKKAMKKGDEVEKMVLDLLRGFDNSKVDLIRWNDLENLNSHKRFTKFFKEKFDEDENFKNEILNIVKSSLSWDFKELGLEKLSEYVLNELPEILSVFVFWDIEYSCYPYPINAKIADFVEKIQKQELFPEIKNKFNFKNMVCVQLELK